MTHLLPEHVAHRDSYLQPAAQGRQKTRRKQVQSTGTTTPGGPTSKENYQRGRKGERRERGKREEKKLVVDAIATSSRNLRPIYFLEKIGKTFPAISLPWIAALSVPEMVAGGKRA